MTKGCNGITSSRCNWPADRAFSPFSWRSAGCGPTSRTSAATEFCFPVLNWLECDWGCPFIGDLIAVTHSLSASVWARSRLDGRAIGRGSRIARRKWRAGGSNCCNAPCGDCCSGNRRLGRCSIAKIRSGRNPISLSWIAWWKRFGREPNRHFSPLRFLRSFSPCRSGCAIPRRQPGTAIRTRRPVPLPIRHWR